MAEAVAAFYAVETVVEGAVVGTLAVAGSTVPLKATFRKIKSPSASSEITGAAVNVIRSKIYLTGGLQNQNSGQVQVLSLPPDFGSSRTKGGDEVVEVDYQDVKPEFHDQSRPLHQHAADEEPPKSGLRGEASLAEWSRTGHASVVVDDKIYILGGSTSSGSIVPLDNILCFDSLRNTYTIHAADMTKCTEGTPSPRTSPSCTVSPFPSAVSNVTTGEGPTIEAHGTIFLHGGYDEHGQALHDTWTLDLGTRAWHKFPSIQELQLDGVEASGRITYINHKLWYVNGSVAMHLDLAEHDPKSSTASHDPSVLSTGRVGSGQWQVVYPPPSDEKPTRTAAPDDLPTKTQAILPVTTGSGRAYLLCMTSPTQMYTFQIPSTPNTLASVKDIVRDQSTKVLPDNWKSGKHEWSRIEIVEEESKTGNKIERPDDDLTDFGVALWQEAADKLIVWGGHVVNTEKDEAANIEKNEGWIVSLQ